MSIYSNINVIVPFVIVVAVAVCALVRLSRFSASASKDRKKVKMLTQDIKTLMSRYDTLARYASDAFFRKDGRIPVDADGKPVPFGVEVSFNSGHMRRHGIFTLNFDRNGKLNTTCPFVFIDERAHERFHPGLVKDIRVVGHNRYL